MAKEDVNQSKINEAVSQLDESGLKRHSHALAQGYKDEVCPEKRCGIVLLAHRPLIRCDPILCPMISKKNLNQDGSPKSMFDMLMESPTKRPTTTLYFIFHFHYWELTVYKEQKNLAKKILVANGVEFQKKSASNKWQKVDQRMLLWMISKAIDEHLEEFLKGFLSDTKKVRQKMKKLIGSA